MLSPLLLMAAASIFSTNSQLPPKGSSEPGPPDVQIISFALGPGIQTGLRVEPRGHEVVRPYELDRTNSGDNTRKMGSIGSPNTAPEASMSNDPYVQNYDTGASPASEPSFSMMVSEKGSLAVALIRNTGSKTIKAIDWDFAFPHIRNNKPMLRYAVHSKSKIKPGESIPVRGFISRSVKTFNQWHGNGPDQPGTLTSTSEGISIGVMPADLREGARIIRIKYSDGSIWNRP